MTDYADAVRQMKTSDLIGCIAHHEVRVRVADPDKALTNSLGLMPLFDPRPEAQAAYAELTRRLAAILVAAAHEIDRRIPIPEGP